MKKIAISLLVIAAVILGGCATNLTVKVDPVPELEVDLTEKISSGIQPVFAPGRSVHLSNAGEKFNDKVIEKLKSRLSSFGIEVATSSEHADYAVVFKGGTVVGSSSLIGPTSAQGAVVGSAAAKGIGSAIPIVGAVTSLTFGTLAVIDHFNGKAKEVNTYKVLAYIEVTPKGATKFNFMTSAEGSAKRNHLPRKDAVEVLSSLTADLYLGTIFQGKATLAQD